MTLRWYPKGARPKTETVAEAAWHKLSQQRQTSGYAGPRESLDPISLPWTCERSTVYRGELSSRDRILLGACEENDFSGWKMVCSPPFRCFGARGMSFSYCPNVDILAVSRPPGPLEVPATSVDGTFFWHRLLTGCATPSPTQRHERESLRNHSGSGAISKMPRRLLFGALDKPSKAFFWWLLQGLGVSKNAGGFCGT